MAKKKKHVVNFLSDVAKHFGISYTTVRGNWRNAGMPVEKDGTYDIAKITAWQDLRMSKQPANARHKNAGNGKGEVDNPVYRRHLVDLRIKETELSKRKRENAIAEGDFVSRDEVETYFANCFSRFRDDMSRIPTEIKSSFPKNCREELVQVLAERINLALATLYRQRHKIEDLTRQE